MRTSAAAQTPSIRYLVALLIVVGVVLRGAWYLADQSLFMDEIALAINVVDRSLVRLVTEALDHDQTAPFGFLVIQKAIVTALGSDEYTLRLSPVLASLVSVPLFWLVAKRLVDRTAAVVALALFIGCSPLLFYAAQMKQYSQDVLVALLLLLLAAGELAVDAKDRAPGRGWTVAVLGGVAPWLSQPAVFLLPGYLLVMFSVAVRQAGLRGVAWRYFAPIAIVWGGSAIAVGLVAMSLTPPESKAFLQAFWDDGISFPASGGATALAWPFVALTELFRDFGYTLPVPGGWRLPALYAAVCAFGGLAAARRPAGLLLLVPILVAFLAATLHLFPLRGRVALFLVPTLLLLTGHGIGALHAVVSRRLGPAVGVLFLAGVLAAPASAIEPVPRRLWDVRAVLDYVARHRQPGDRIYVYYGAAPATAVYATHFGLAPAQLDIGGCHRHTSARAYLRELDRYKGAGRLWLVLNHAPPRESVAITEYLRAAGRVEDEFVAEGGSPPTTARAILFDLVPGAASNVDAETFPLPEGQGEPRWRLICDRGPIRIGQQGDVGAYANLVR